MSLIDYINDLKKVNSLSKHEQLVNGIINAINDGILVTGDQLPSINKMVSELGFARKTIVKAYEELKGRGLVESKKLKGYFIISQETKVTLKIALLMYSLKRFQEEFYETFRKELGQRYQIDVFFHHNNVSIFETIMSNIKGKYGMYVVAPIPNPKVVSQLQKIDASKLLIIDRYVSLGNDYSYISQEFEQTTYNKLVELLPVIRNYKKYILFFRDDLDYPVGVLNAYNKFLKDYNIKGGIQDKYEPQTVKKGTLYSFISDTFLWEVLRDCRNNEYVIGKDVGILSHNEHVVKEIVFGGITTISTDFRDMAKKAADHVKKGEKTQLTVLPNLIKRNSL